MSGAGRAVPKGRRRYTAADFAADTGVSRETLDRFQRYAALLEKWQPRINLIGDTTLDDIWKRHFLDSAQLLPFVADRGDILDIGSGAGFPGLVLAILGAGPMHLVESDGRKAAFLAEAARVTGARVVLHAQRLEKIQPWPVGVVISRGVGTIDKIYGLSKAYHTTLTRLVLLRGEQVQEELTRFEADGNITVSCHPSKTSESGTIVVVEALRHVG